MSLPIIDKPTTHDGFMKALEEVNEGNFPPEQNQSLIRKIINDWKGLRPFNDLSDREIHGTDFKKICDKFNVSDRIVGQQFPNFSTVALFEQKIAEFFGAPYAVAVDSCTHGLELCLRYTEATFIDVPHNTYLSVAMLAEKLNIERRWFNIQWQKLYYLTNKVIDAATLWEKDSYREDTFMCISFQHAKHLSIGRAGCILTDNKEAAEKLRKLAYDGRIPNIPWREQDIEDIGFHYYCQPELAALGLSKIDEAMCTIPLLWDSSMYPDISKFKVFNNKVTVNMEAHYGLRMHD